MDAFLQHKKNKFEHEENMKKLEDEQKTKQESGKSKQLELRFNAHQYCDKYYNDTNNDIFIDCIKKIIG
jgi:Skp family chaperone for outer membrane proteins